MFSWENQMKKVWKQNSTKIFSSYIPMWHFILISSWGSEWGWLQNCRNESHSHHFQLQCNVLLHQIFNAFCLMMGLIDNSTHAPLSVDMTNRNAQWKERLFTFHSWHTLALKQVVPSHQTFLCCHAFKTRPWPDGESHSILWVSRSLESICKNRWNLRLVLLFLNVGQITTPYLKVIILIWH